MQEWQVYFFYKMLTKLRAFKRVNWGSIKHARERKPEPEGEMTNNSARNS